MVRIFEVLADQLAIAIENARLLAESDRRLQKSITSTASLPSSWQDSSRKKALAFPGYLYDQIEITPLAGDPLPDLAPNRTEIPIQVHGAMVGHCHGACSNEQLSRDEHMLVSGCGTCRAGG